MINFVSVQFDLPFLLRIKDSLQGDSIEGVEEYFVMVDVAEILLRFKMNIRETSGFSIATEDIRGQLSYSTVKVFLNKQYFKSVGITDTFRGFEICIWETALKAINQFIEIYRRETNSSWVNPVISSEIYNYHIAAIKEGKVIDHYHKGSLGTGKSIGNYITDDEEARIRNKLNSFWLADDLERLAFSAEHQFLMENYWGSTLSIGIYCEAFLSRIIRASYSKLGLSEDEINFKFLEDDKKNRLSFTKFLKNSINELLNQNVRSKKSEVYKYYDAWTKDTRDVRNDLAHGKKISVTKELAEKAMISGKALMNYLNQKLN